MFKVISVDGAIGGFGNVSADMVTHAAAIAVMRATLVSAWREKYLFFILFIIILVLLTVLEYVIMGNPRELI